MDEKNKENKEYSLLENFLFAAALFGAFCAGMVIKEVSFERQGRLIPKDNDIQWGVVKPSQVTIEKKDRDTIPGNETYINVLDIPYKIGFDSERGAYFINDHFGKNYGVEK
jgi:hypothetical protein